MSERGAALVLALMAVLLLSALGVALVLVASAESMIASNYANAIEGLYAADAGAERAMDDLLLTPDWSAVADGSTTSAFVDGVAGGVRTLADGSTLDLAQVVGAANAGAPNPAIWQLYACGPVNNLLPAGAIDSPFYIVVLVADELSQSQALTLRAEAFGPRGTHKIVELTIARTEAEGDLAPPNVRVLSWRELR